jgi:hypothetical protein
MTASSLLFVLALLRILGSRVSEGLVEWLKAQLAEDERVAREALQGPLEERWRSSYHLVKQRGYINATELRDMVIAESKIGTARHIARWDPSRVLREVEAKRKIIKLHPLTTYTDEEPGYSQVLNDHVCPGDQTPCETLRLLALPYSDRPGFQENWRPA